MVKIVDETKVERGQVVQCGAKEDKQEGEEVKKKKREICNRRRFQAVAATSTSRERIQVMPVLLDTTCEDRLDDQSSGLLAKNSERAPTEKRLTIGVDHDGTKR